jgi:predicted amidohydrolase YtcJ
VSEPRLGLLLLRQVEVAGRVCDVRIVGDRIAEISERGASLEPRPAEVIDAGGGALLPGLHDHHLHLLALAAAARSVLVGPPEVTSVDTFARRLIEADGALDPGRWLRAVGYHESVAGPIDRWSLDRLVPERPVRVQHRSGAQWTLNSAAAEAIGLADAEHAGIERDDRRRPTGRLYGVDDWLRDRLPPDAPLDLAGVGARLARYGVTGVTDATPTERIDDVRQLAVACSNGSLPLTVAVTGGSALAGTAAPPPLVTGPVKLMVADHELPAIDRLAAAIAGAHGVGRPVAVHCVTRVALVLALAAWRDAGSITGDRVEHGAVVPPELSLAIAELGLTVVTQPNFVAERGDRYLADVDLDDQPHLYPCRSLLDMGIPVGGSTDAPFGHPDPWRAIAAAVARRTQEGQVLGAAERVSAERALALFLARLDDPGGPARRVEVGSAADLCLLRVPLVEGLASPDAEHVAVTVRAGQVVHSR